MTDFDVLIVGNGVLGTSLAFELSTRNPDIRIGLIGPESKDGAASMAAGAMLACYAEIEKGSLDSKPAQAAFELSRESAQRWPGWISRLNAALGEERLSINLGTYVLHNALADELDDVNFDAITQCLRRYDEDFSVVDPLDIPGYLPENRGRALRAIYIPGEGAINPIAIAQAMEEVFERSACVEPILDYAEQVRLLSNGLKAVTTRKGQVYRSKKVILAAGSNTSALIEGIDSLQGKIPRLFYGVGTALLIRSGLNTPPKVIRTANRGLACGVHLVPRAAEHSYIGASNFISPWPEYHPRMTSLFSLLQSAMEQLDRRFYKAQVEQVFVGHRPTSADSYPLLGETSVEGLWVMSGTKRIGIHWSPVVVSAMADHIEGGDWSLNQMFLPERDLIRTMTRSEGINKAVAHLKSAAFQHELHLPKSGWDDMFEDMLRRRVEAVYESSGVTEFGIHPELLDMYKYGHIQGDCGASNES